MRSKLAEQISMKLTMYLSGYNATKNIQQLYTRTWSCVKTSASESIKQILILN